MGIRRLANDQRLAPILGVGIALIAGTTLVAYTMVGSQVGSSLRGPRSIARVTPRVTVAVQEDPQPIVLPAPEVEAPAPKPEPVTTETVELVAQVDTSSEDPSTEPETFSGGISGDAEPGLTDRIAGSIAEFVSRGKIGPSEGSGAPWGSPPVDDDPGSHTGGIEGDPVDSEADGQEQAPADDEAGQEWDWNEPGNNGSNGSGSGSKGANDGGGSDAPEGDDQAADQGPENGKEDDDAAEGEDDSDGSDNDDDNDDSGSSGGSDDSGKGSGSGDGSGGGSGDSQSNG